jgi:hypothetical protein
VFDGSVNDPGPTQAIRRQVSAVRRRSNLHVVQHAIALWVAISAGAATLVVLSAVRGGHGAFMVVALAALVALCATTVLLGRRVRVGWMAARDAPGRIDAARGLRGRLPSLFELDRPDGRARGPLFSLLVHQTVEAMPSWRATEVVPDVMPIRVLASAIAALCALAMVVVMAPALRPAPPRVLVGDRRIDVSPADDTRDGADTLLVSPGTERPAPRREGTGDASQDTAGAAGPLAGASTALRSLQTWLQQTLDAEESWDAGEPVPSNPAANGQHAASREHHAATTAAVDDHAATGAGTPTDAPGATPRHAGGTSTEPGGGGPGEGAGTDTDSTLYGKPDDEPVTGRDRFELGIAARVRTRRGSDTGSWSDAPAADGDRHPVLASQHRAEQPGHRMPVPPAFAPLVSRLFAHTQPGEGDSR